MLADDGLKKIEFYRRPDLRGVKMRLSCILENILRGCKRRIRGAALPPKRMSLDI
jgi:hypothetical protein